MNTMIRKPKSDMTALPCALIQGAPSRLHVATVVLLAPDYAQFEGGAVADVKRGGQGSRAWRPPA
ncbi:hypothetical protein EV643_122103 [Kribbella sp. VKM Ac-2527]|uniref:Uncharacterized protein n=1 Tax=Kribbella caucasensis TaxID=2512215 RepID=A0A4R6JJ07_9ACTN|nr:hypothetical protein EV643_122103 [Kribbella sp. VKM Ac-2527]